jgi:hypothetical protein
MPPSSPPRRQRLITAASRCLCALVLALWTVPLAAAREPLDGSQQPLVRIPGAVARATDGAIAIRAGDRELVYVEGFGWLGDVSAPEPQLRDGEVYGTPALLAALGLDVATLEAVRFAGDTEVRVVLDVPALDEASLRHLTRSGEVAPGEGVRLNLPPLLLPAGLLQTYGGLEVLLEQDLDGVIVEIVGGAFRYEVFTVPGPTRVVLDLKLERPPLEPDTSQVLAEGIVYRRLQAEGSGGLSRVHVIDVAPGVGEWRVVGTPGEVRTTDRWADGGFAAINGGYFDTSTRQVIGMLVVDGVLLSLPSRGRAVVAFGDGPPIIDRVKASYSVWLDGVPVAVRGAPFVDEVNVVTGPGYAGSARYGVLVVDELDGRGPRQPRRTGAAPDRPVRGRVPGRAAGPGARRARDPRALHLARHARGLRQRSLRARGRPAAAQGRPQRARAGARDVRRRPAHPRRADAAGGTRGAPGRERGARRGRVDGGGRPGAAPAAPRGERRAAPGLRRQHDPLRERQGHQPAQRARGRQRDRLAPAVSVAGGARNAGMRLRSLS